MEVVQVLVDKLGVIRLVVVWVSVPQVEIVQVGNFPGRRYPGVMKSRR